MSPVTVVAIGQARGGPDSTRFLLVASVYVGNPAGLMPAYFAPREPRTAGMVRRMIAMSPQNVRVLT